MAPQVPESAQLAYSFDNLMVFEPSGGGQISILEANKRNWTAPKAILPAYKRHRVVRFAPRGVQGRPGGPKKL